MFIDENCVSCLVCLWAGEGGGDQPTREGEVPRHLVSASAHWESGGNKNCLDVGDDDLGVRDGYGGQDLAALLNVDDGGTGRADGAAAADGRGAREGHGAEVSKGHEAAALLKVLDDPLGVELL